MTSNITLITSFFAGLISFLSPCVLPIVPGFLAYLAGSSLSEAGNRRRDIVVNTLFFIFGFSLVFAALGILLNTILLSVSFSVQAWLSRIGGIFIIFFGLYLTGVISIPFLEREYKMSVNARFSSRFFSSFVFGAAFAAGWTPCVGPVLGAILGLAAAAPGSAFWLLMSYSLGLSLPFLLVGFFAVGASSFIQRFISVVRYINITFGIVLIFLGILVFTQNLSLIANFDLLNQFLLSK
jgi:cytochrome c-type biogenesis protein